MIIGLTGGIASGKSTVALMLARRGAYIADADQTAREIVEPGEPALEAAASLFGQAILNSDKSLNRQALGEIVFRDKDKLKALESITHPAIRERMNAKIEAFQKKDPDGLIVADIPLLYETKQEQAYDGIMVVYVPASLQIERLMARNNMSHSEAEKRVALQMDIEQKKQLADWVIDNSGTLEETEKQVELFFENKGFL